MRPYALCLLAGRSGSPVQRTEFVARDDDAAILHALAFCRTHLVEVLSGERIIARIPQGTRHLHAVQRADPQSRERNL